MLPYNPHIGGLLWDYIQTWGFCKDINGIDLDDDDDNKEDTEKDNDNNYNKDESDKKGISALGLDKDHIF